MALSAYKNRLLNILFLTAAILFYIAPGNLLAGDDDDDDDDDDKISLPSFGELTAGIPLLIHPRLLPSFGEFIGAMQSPPDAGDFYPLLPIHGHELSSYDEGLNRIMGIFLPDEEESARGDTTHEESEVSGVGNGLEESPGTWTIIELDTPEGSIAGVRSVRRITPRKRKQPAVSSDEINSSNAEKTSSKKKRHVEKEKEKEKTDEERSDENETEEVEREYFRTAIRHFNSDPETCFTDIDGLLGFGLSSRECVLRYIGLDTFNFEDPDDDPSENPLFRNQAFRSLLSSEHPYILLELVLKKARLERYRRDTDLSCSALGGAFHYSASVITRLIRVYMDSTFYNAADDSLACIANINDKKRYRAPLKAPLAEIEKVLKKNRNISIEELMIIFDCCRATIVTRFLERDMIKGREAFLKKKTSENGKGQG